MTADDPDHPRHALDDVNNDGRGEVDVDVRRFDRRKPDQLLGQPIGREAEQVRRAIQTDQRFYLRSRREARTGQFQVVRAEDRRRSDVPDA